MKGSRFTEEQIIGILREQERGAKTAEVCRKHGISPATFYKCKAKYSGLDVSEALEDENRRKSETSPPNYPESFAVCAGVWDAAWYLIGTY